MSLSSPLPLLSSLLLVALVCVLTCGGQLCQKLAVERWRQLAVSLPLTARLMRISGWLSLAILMLALALVLWLWALQSLPLGVAYPMLSVNFVLTALAARYFFRELLSQRHLLGIACIVLGVILLGAGL